MTQPGRMTLAGATSLAALFAAVPAAAASQGTLGAASRGSIAISVSLRAPARVAGLADVTLDGEVRAQELCLRGSARGYTVVASGSGPDGSLTLSNGAERLDYQVDWLDRSSEDPTTARSPGAPSAADCAPGSGQLRIALDPAAAERLGTGTPYTGALVLTVVPE